MKILVVGSGGREHALTWKLAQSPSVDSLIAAPGNPGVAEFADLTDVAAEDVPVLVELAKNNDIDLVVVGPEVPLVDGLADRLQEEEIKVFGPSAAAARIEGSKSWANDLMYRHRIPCPASASFTESARAIGHIESQPAGSIVVKADGLAAGKGVVVPETPSDAIAAVHAALDEGAFGRAGAKVVIEERLTGEELSVFAFVDGEHVSNLVAARDYKRAYDANQGANTGGMGAFTTPDLYSEDELAIVKSTVLEPIAQALVEVGCSYQGILYAGLMLTDDGPQVIEFNCRFGDPECEPLMMRLESDLAEICLATAEGNLDSIQVVWNNSAAVSVVVVSEGYPEAYETSFPIEGDLSTTDDSIIFHAGTALDEHERLVTAGGRVLVPTAVSTDSLSDARDAAYRRASLIEFEGARYRSDIAAQATAAAVMG